MNKGQLPTRLIHPNPNTLKTLTLNPSNGCLLLRVALAGGFKGKTTFWDTLNKDTDRKQSKWIRDPCNTPPPPRPPVESKNPHLKQVSQTTSWMVYKGHSTSHSLHLSHQQVACVVSMEKVIPFFSTILLFGRCFPPFLMAF